MCFTLIYQNVLVGRTRENLKSAAPDFPGEIKDKNKGK